jgi:hypothetical protein
MGCRRDLRPEGLNPLGGNVPNSLGGPDLRSPTLGDTLNASIPAEAKPLATPRFCALWPNGRAIRAE